jgi:hypothetical protein
MEKDDEVAEALELSDITEALGLPPATGDRRKKRGPRTQLREALENDAELDLRMVNDQELHDSDAAYLARIDYVTSYLRLYDFLRQPADTFAKRLAMAKVSQSHINNAESTRLHALQIGRNTTKDDELKKQILKLKKNVRTLSEKRAVMIYDEKKAEEDALRTVEESETGES